MPRAKVTGAIVSHIWDDDSTSEYKITMGRDDQSGPYVMLDQGGDMIALRPESWPEIRDQIQSMMDEIGSES